MTYFRSSRSPEAFVPRDALWCSSLGFWAGRTILLHHDERRDSARLEALLTIACQRRLSKRDLQSVNAAIDDSRRGDQSLANLRLAIARLPRLPDSSDCSVRISTAKALLANGCATTDLLQAAGLGLDNELAKFDPDQPRVPAGNGCESGRWTCENANGQTASSMVIADAAAFAERRAPLLVPTLGADVLAALSALAGTVGFAATLGVLFVPSPNNTSSSGPLPGDTENTYSYNQDEGLLRVLGPSGVVLAAGHKDGSGVFYDADTGVPFAREVDGALVFDGASLQTVTEHAEPTTTTAAEEDEEDDEAQPKLCPDPGPDQPGSIAASKRARDYQEQVSAMINPQRPLEFGLAMNLINPTTGAIVHYDECDEQSGTMIEAKGPGFDGLLSFPKGQNNVTNNWLSQGQRELQAAGSRQVVWYFAEDYAAAYARSLFADRDLGKIVVRVQHPW